MDNLSLRGFRFYSTLSGSATPVTLPGFVDTLESFDVASGGSNCTLTAGDLVRRKASGGWEQADGSEATAESVGAVVHSVGNYWDAGLGRMRPTDKLPSDVAWGTNLERRSTIRLIPVESAIWEVDVTGGSATTRADYDAMGGANANHVLTGSTDGGFLLPKLDLATLASTSTLFWRVVGVSQTQANKDFSGANVKLLVVANTAQVPAHNGLTGV